MADALLVSISDGVAEVRLNRSEVLNAFNDDLFEGLIEVGQALRADAALRAVVISGEGGTQLLPQPIGFDRARDLVHSGRTFTGADAERIGLVTALFDDPLDAARKWARHVATRNPQTIRNAKALKALAQPVDTDALVGERTAMWATIGSPNQVVAVRANMEGRSPRFA